MSADLCQRMQRATLVHKSGGRAASAWAVVTHLSLNNDNNNNNNNNNNK
jgi:hypothetical protein